MSSPVASNPHGKYIQANELDIYYEEYGQGEPLILLHGGTATSGAWQPLIPSLAPHFRVLAPDSRGHGRTSNPTGELSYRVMADDVAAFSHALGLKRPLICGYSDGGHVALEIGMRYPDLAQALVVGAASYKFSAQYLNALRAMGFEGPGVVNFDKLQTALPRLAEGWSAAHAPLGGPDYWRTLLQQISTMWLTPLDYTADELGAITAPTLILMGDRDQLIPVEQALEMYRQVPSAELAILPNADHEGAIAGTSDVNALFLSIVLDFLSRHRALRNE